MAFELIVIGMLGAILTFLYYIFQAILHMHGLTVWEYIRKLVKGEMP
jgi:hypothetical protein